MLYRVCVILQFPCGVADDWININASPSNYQRAGGTGDLFIYFCAFSATLSADYLIVVRQNFKASQHFHVCYIHKNGCHTKQNVCNSSHLRTNFCVIVETEIEIQISHGFHFFYNSRHKK